MVKIEYRTAEVFGIRYYQVSGWKGAVTREEYSKGVDNFLIKCLKEQGKYCFAAKQSNDKKEILILDLGNSINLGWPRNWFLRKNQLLTEIEFKTISKSLKNANLAMKKIIKVEIESKTI